jgi:hypothetical protein
MGTIQVHTTKPLSHVLYYMKMNHVCFHPTISRKIHPRQEPSWSFENFSSPPATIKHQEGCLPIHSSHTTTLVKRPFFQCIWFSLWFSLFALQWHVGKRNHRHTTTRASVLWDAILSRDAILPPLSSRIALLKVRLLTVSVMKLMRRTSLSPIRSVLSITVAAKYHYPTTDRYQRISSPNRAIQKTNTYY